MIFGSGSPVAMQIKAAIPPAFTFWLIGASLITGGSATNKKEQTLIYWELKNRNFHGSLRETNQ